MNDNDNNILIAKQEECDVALIDGTKVFRYKDGDGNIQSVDIASITNGTSLFENNQNIDVNWEIDLPTLTNATNMFKGSNIKSFTNAIPQNTISASMFANCENLEYVATDIPVNLTRTSPVKTYDVALSNSFNGCTSLKEVKLKKPNDLSAGITNFNGSSLFAGCTNLESVDIDFIIKRTTNYNFYRYV